MNEGCQIYLKTYSAVDKVDQMLKEWGVFYISWKWWHAPVRHGKAIGYCTAYQMYCKCAGESINRLWKLVNPMSAPEFWERASLQMCQYQSSHKKYPGDVEMRTTTQKPKLRWAWKNRDWRRMRTTSFRYCMQCILMLNFQEGRTAHCAQGPSNF